MMNLKKKVKAKVQMQEKDKKKIIQKEIIKKLLQIKNLLNILSIILFFYI